MIPTLEKLREEVHTRVKDLRCIDIMINGEEFKELWNQLTPDQQLLIVNHVAWINKTALSNMIKKIKSKELTSMNMIQLRALGKKRGLTGFMQMSKSTLLSELSKLEGLDYGDEE